MNYQNLTKEILIALRGELNQRELSSKLGYQFNQVGKWEAGATLFHWQDFIKVCEVNSIPWRKHTEEIFLFHSTHDDQTLPLFQILCQFHGPLDFDDLAAALGKSRSSLQRLLQNQVKLDFVDALRLMDYRPYVLQSWLSRFVACDKLPSAAEKFERETLMLKSLLSLPFAPIVNAALRLDSYRALEKHSDQWVATQAGVSLLEARAALSKLVESGAVQKRNDTYIGLFQEITMLKVPEFRRVTQYLNESIAEKFRPDRATKPDLTNPSISATRVYPASHEASRAIADAIVEFHHKVSQILKSDRGKKTHVRAVVLHSLDMSILAESSVAAGVARPAVAENAPL